jgi:hypothetical protein
MPSLPNPELAVTKGFLPGGTLGNISLKSRDKSRYVYDNVCQCNITSGLCQNFSVKRPLERYLEQ